jgi:septum formation protein
VSAQDAEHAKAMLRSLSGRVHHVVTGVAVVFAGCVRPEGVECSKISIGGGASEATSIVFSEQTEVKFAELDEEVIDAYVATGEPMDKAGSYGIQGLAGTFVTSINGCYHNVMGLPISRLCTEMLPFLRVMTASASSSTTTTAAAAAAAAAK